MSHQRLPDGIENQLAAMQQSRLHPHDWRVLERLIREALADQYASLRAQVQALQQQLATAHLFRLEDGMSHINEANQLRARAEAAAAEIAQLHLLPDKWRARAKAQRALADSEDACNPIALHAMADANEERADDLLAALTSAPEGTRP
jgi:hypothetical protein